MRPIVYFSSTLKALASWRPILFFLLALTPLTGTPAFATTVRSIPFDTLAARAEVAAYVRVVSQSARVEGGRIVTDSECEVLDAAFGAPVGSLVTLTTLGGVVGSIGQQVFGLERPAPGDELALLLGSEGYMGGGRRLVGFSLGLFHVVRAESQPVGDAPLLGYAVETTGTAARESASTPLTLGEFLMRAKQARGL